MRLIQVTDCHVSADPAAGYRGINPRLNLESCLDRVREWAPDLVLATGDLSDDASEESFRYLAEQFGTLSVPVMALPGNHDDPGLLRKYFASSALDGPLVFNGESWQLVLLNSVVDGEVPGRLGQAMLRKLEIVLKQNELPKLIALHHQPLLVGSPWIDKYPLLEPESFWKVLRDRDDVRLVLWGHIHHAVDIDVSGIRALGSPSTSSNSLPGMERFAFDESGPACRWLELHADGSFDTGILFAA